jgi:acetamidase/formamidase
MNNRHARSGGGSGAAFLGVMGVVRAEDGAFRARAPGSFGGNLDVRELSAGSRHYLPVIDRGVPFS